MKNPSDLSRNELAQIVIEGVRILYGLRQEDGSWTYAADKEWFGADVCQELASLLNRFDLVPRVEGGGEPMEPARRRSDKARRNAATIDP